jgi:hypothetical protein
MFDVHRGRILESAGFGGLAMEPVPGTPSRTTLFDLMLDISEQEQGMQAAFTWNTDVFDEATVAALARDYVQLIEASTAQPEVRLEALMQGLREPAGAQEVISSAAPAVLDQVLAVTRGVLGCTALDAQAGFFEQGGTSLQAVAVIHGLNRCWSADIPLQLIFLHRTIADFARAIAPYAPQAHQEFRCRLPR